MISFRIKSNISRNISFLYVSQITNFILPLITFPYLARILKPEVFGLVMYSFAFSMWLILTLEYGFNLSATREIARHRDDKTKISGIVNSVQGAKLLLSSFTIALSLIALNVFTVFSRHPAILLWTLAYSLTQGLSPIWYFQGIEKLKIPVLTEAAAGILATISLVVFVHSPEDGELVLFIKFISGSFSLIITSFHLYKNIKFSFPKIKDSMEALKSGLSMFVFRSSVSMYTTANTLLLGLIVPMNFVAFYSGAEKISKAGLALMNPISQAVFPRMSHLFNKDPKAANSLGILTLLIISITGITAGILIFILAPWLVKILFGSGYEQSVSVLRILFLLTPLIAISNVLGIQYMVPLKMDKQFNYIIISAGIMNILMGVVLSKIWNIWGMAISVVITESFVSLTMLIVLLKTKKILFTRIKLKELINV